MFDKGLRSIEVGALGRYRHSFLHIGACSALGAIMMGERNIVMICGSSIVLDGCRDVEGGERLLIPSDVVD